MLPSSVLADADGVRSFYENEGWKADEAGVFTDTKAFLDTRELSMHFTRRCITRLGKYFRAGGEYLLDAGSGPIAHPELIDYGNAFERRVCVDLSASALRTARTKLGDRGIYVQGDLTNLPIKSNSMDAVTCNHVIYQIPDASMQAAAFLELWRVLKPGGVGVVVYWWPHAPLAWRIERLVRLFNVHRQSIDEVIKEDAAHLVHKPQSRDWFEAQDWPFDYDYDVFRVVSNEFMRTHVPDDWRGGLILNTLFAMQALVPAYCGKHGIMPALILHKRAEPA